jgi:hypothetical protein
MSKSLVVLVLEDKGIEHQVEDLAAGIVPLTSGSLLCLKAGSVSDTVKLRGVA